MFDLERSPIRKNIKTLKEGQLSIFEEEDLFSGGDSNSVIRFQVRTILKDVENMLKTMEENKGKQLKIAVLGEVKAGKSTFINACVGKKVAYTDVLEATAIVSEISYSENEYARVLDNQGKIVLHYNFEELIGWIEEKTDNMENFSDYKKIEIGVHNELLKNIVLVDTPGLLSITSENHEITNEYIAQTDYVIWVINSRNLGSKAVNDFIDKIKLSGKPLIGVINKVDSEEEQLEIKEYVEKEYGSVFEEIFYISAENAWNAFINRNTIQEKKSGINEVLECLEDLTEDKGHSNAQTQYYQLQREREIHMKMHATISARKKYYDNELATFAQINKEMKKVILAELKNWLNTELYMEEKANLMNSNREEFKKLFESYSSAPYLTDIIENKYHEMLNYTYRKWDLVENSLTKNSSQVLIDFKYDRNIDADISDGSSVDVHALSADGAKKGLKNGTVVGLAFAGYTAWLGPAATTVTFMGTLIPYVLPLAVGGAILGSWLGKRSIKTVDLEKNAKQKQELVEDLYQEVVRTAEKEINQIGQALFACTDKYYEDRCTFYQEKSRIFNFDFTQPEYGRFNTELEAYIQCLNNLINEMDNEPMEDPPKI